VANAGLLARCTSWYLHKIWLVHPRLSQVIFTLDASERRRDDDRADGGAESLHDLILLEKGENDDSY
jgi:hypothetical protein